MSESEAVEESRNVGSFTTRDETSTLLAQRELVEPAGVHHSKHKEVPLVDPNEELLRITDHQRLLSWLGKEHDRITDVISEAIGQDFDTPVLMGHRELVIGNVDSPNTWVRMGSTKPDTENGRLNFFRNIHLPGLVDSYTSPPGEAQKEEGTLVSIDLDAAQSAQTEHRRTPLSARRIISGEDLISGYDITRLEENNIGVWLVQKTKQD